MSNLQKVVAGAEGFNRVNAWLTPNGELVISLTHRSTDDGHVLVRVRTDEDVTFVYEAFAEYDGDADSPWEDPDTQLGRLNKGGNWA